MWSQLDLNLLRILDTVLSERSVVRAARRLHVTPSAISNALARLRSALGDPLVIRSGRGIVPTPRAVELAPSLKRTLGELERAVRIEVFDPATTTKQFTLAVADAGQVARLPRLVKLLAKEMPRARLRVIGLDTYLSSGGFSGTEVDVALLAPQEKISGVHEKSLYVEHSVLVCRRHHRLVGRRITKTQLAELQHVEVEVAPGRGYRELSRAYTRLGIERRVAVIVPSFVAAAAVVADSEFVATLPASLVEAYGERIAVSVLQSPAPKMATEVKLVWAERTNDDTAMRAFRKVVMSAMK
jgi:DNA-binding transcriptional LysR family regulator